MSHGLAAGAGDAPAKRAGDRLSLERLHVAWLDRALPACSVPFAALVVVLSVGVWFVGLALAEDHALPRQPRVAGAAALSRRPSPRRPALRDGLRRRLSLRLPRARHAARRVGA